MNTYFMEKSYVVAAILCTKYLHMRENFVTLEECSEISDLLQKEYNKKNQNVCITREIDNEYFKVSDGIIIINKEKNIDLKSVETRYKGYIPNIDILLTLWNEEFILNALRKIRMS